ncbi:MAG: DUF5668 domain-containing protein [Chitinophagaceae bacterium]
MDNQDNNKGNSRIVAGLFLLGIGCVLFLKQFGFYMPGWLFRWPVILIIVGLFIGLRHNFRGPAWLILLLIGSIFLSDSINPEYSIRRYTAPVIIIGIGLMMILRPHRNRNKNRYYAHRDWQNNLSNQDQPGYQYPPEQEAFQEKKFSREDYIDSVAIFGNVLKVVVSKDFKGGDMVAIFGGNEIDLSKADINGRVVLDVTVILGGTKLILPSHWDVKSEMVAFFGGIEDKRQIPAGVNNPAKLLILKGTSIFGGIEIRSY